MTHHPNIPILWLLATAGIFLFMTGLPVAGVVEMLWNGQRSRKAAAAALAAIWLVAYPNTVWRWHRHGQMEHEVYRRADCLGYGHGAMMPERCSEAIAQATVVPDGFFFWSAISLGLAVVCMVVVVGVPYVEEWDWGWSVSVRPW